MKEIFLIRHGETDYNKRGIVQGRGINSPLNRNGSNQAKKFFERYKTEPFEIIYTSTLKRAIDTSMPFIEKGIVHESHPTLDEISWGKFEGKKINDVLKNEFENIVNQWRMGNLEAKTENGESPLELQQKHFDFIELLRNRPQKKILVCMHGRAMRIMLCTMTGKALNEMDHFPHHNLSLYRLKFDNKKFEIDIFNDISHLHDPI